MTRFPCYAHAHSTTSSTQLVCSLARCHAFAGRAAQDSRCDANACGAPSAMPCASCSRPQASVLLQFRTAIVHANTAVRLRLSWLNFSSHLPCRVKFGAFHEHLETRCEGEFDRIASGHYARLLRDPGNANGPVRLALTPDAIKDQTYFLAHLTRQQLSRVMFPLGPLTKVYCPHIACIAWRTGGCNRSSSNARSCVGGCALAMVKGSARCVTRGRCSWQV